MDGFKSKLDIIGLRRNFRELEDRSEDIAQSQHKGWTHASLKEISRTLSQAKSYSNSYKISALDAINSEILKR